LPCASGHASNARNSAVKGRFTLARAILERNRRSAVGPAPREGARVEQTSHFAEQAAAYAGHKPGQRGAAPAASEAPSDQRDPATEQIEGHSKSVQCFATATHAPPTPAAVLAKTARYQRPEAAQLISLNFIINKYKVFSIFKGGEASAASLRVRAAAIVQRNLAH